eukprot:3232010-Ditylum_brightwellii.AAC.1
MERISTERINDERDDKSRNNGRSNICERSCSLGVHDCNRVDQVIDHRQVDHAVQPYQRSLGQGDLIVTMMTMTSDPCCDQYQLDQGLQGYEEVLIQEKGMIMARMIGLINCSSIWWGQNPVKLVKIMLKMKLTCVFCQHTVASK